MKNFVIISNSDPQYIFFKNKLEKIGFKNYFIINNKIKKKFLDNFKLSIKNNDNSQIAYSLMIPLYGFVLYFAMFGYKKKTW